MENFQTQQVPLLLPEFDYQLESIVSVQKELDPCARSLKAFGFDVLVQLGSQFAWAFVKTESEDRSRNESMARATIIPCIMTGQAIVDGAS